MDKKLILDEYLIEIKAYRDFWLDNAIENFYRILIDIQENLEDLDMKILDNYLIFSFTNFENLKNILIYEIKHRYKNMICLEEDKDTGVSKEVKKDYILLQEGTKKDGLVKLKEKVYDWNKLPKILDIVFESSFESSKNIKTCIICGKPYRKSFELKQSVYPLATKTRSLSGIRTLKTLPEYYKNICPLCYFLGVLEWTDDVLVFRTLIDSGKSYLFIPVFENLVKLNKFKENVLYSGILSKTSRYTNLLVKPKSDETEDTLGEYTTLLAFYEKFIKDASITLEETCKVWAVLHIPLGKVKNVKLETIKISEGILSVIKSLIEKDQMPYQMLKEIFFKTKTVGGYQTDWDLTNNLREELAKNFLFDNFRGFTKALLPRKGGFVSFTYDARTVFEELIYRWRWEKLGISKENLGIIKSVGNIIAKLSLENPSLLYKLDKTRNLDEFWSVLREISRKMTGLDGEKLKEIKPTSIDELIVLIKENENIWKEIRDLLVVYSSMYLAIKKLDKEVKVNERY